MMDKHLYLPEGTSRAEIVVKKSRFISQCFYIESEKDAKAIIRKLWDEHSDAGHIVYGFIFGDPNSETMGMSDDREPKGTAGRPVLTVIKGSRITNILCTVIRYFGGIKLGTGGLVKAYTESVQEALKNLKVKEMIQEVRFSTTAGYELYDHIKRAVKKLSGEIIYEKFTDYVYLEILIPEKYFKDITAAISDISSGKTVFKILH